MEKEWYVVNTYSGHESKVKEKLEAKTEWECKIIFSV